MAHIFLSWFANEISIHPSLVPTTSPLAFWPIPLHNNHDARSKGKSRLIFHTISNGFHIFAFYTGTSRLPPRVLAPTLDFLDPLSPSPPPPPASDVISHVREYFPCISHRNERRLRACLHGVRLTLLGGSPFYKGPKIAPLYMQSLIPRAIAITDFGPRGTTAQSLSTKQPK